MREWCSCGASIRARRGDVLVWRQSHRCNVGDPEPEPQKQGSLSRLEQSEEPRGTYDGQRYLPTINARIIGFTRE